MTIAHLEKAAKIAGALAAIVSVLIAGGNWALTYAMTERDAEISSLREDVNDLKAVLTAMTDVTEERFNENEERVVALRLAMEALRVQSEMRYAPAITEDAPVRVVRRTTRSRSLPRLPSAGSGSTSAIEPPAHDEVLELHDIGDADVAFDSAMSDFDEAAL